LELKLIIDAKLHVIYVYFYMCYLMYYYIIVGIDNTFLLK